MRSQVPHPATPRELQRVLKIPREDRAAFKRNLRSLLSDGALVEIKGNRYGLPDRMDLVVGKFDGHPSGFGFVIPERPIEGLKRDIYIAEHNLKAAMHGDRVVARIERYREDGRAEGQIVEVLERVSAAVASAPRPACVISSGETTVRVTGKGTGGRNLEFALVLAERLAQLPACAVTSIGTDGIDGSSGVAGGIVDATTMSRAAAAGLDAPGKFLAANDSFAFFAPLGDVVRLGRTDTNVGDLQVLLID